MSFGVIYMPTYDYRCEHCGVFEVKQRITEDPLTVCPTCGGSAMRLLSKNVNVLYRGSGWHCTDYRSGSYNTSDASKMEEAMSVEPPPSSAELPKVAS